MKRQTRSFVLAGVAGLALSALIPLASHATTLDLNGDYIKFEDSNQGLTNLKGTTMVSDDFLADECQMEVTRSGKSIVLTNAFHDFTLEAKIGDKAYVLNGEKHQLSTPPSEKNGKVYLPLRSVMSLFGTVDWYAEWDTVAVRFDFNDYVKMPTATMDEKTLAYEMSEALPTPPEPEWEPIKQTEDGLLYQKWDKDNYLTAVGTEDKDIITPVHDGYVLRGTTCVIEEDYLYWVEHPVPETQESWSENWYLYMQERKPGAKPVCIDEGPFGDLQELTFGIYTLDNCDFKNGNMVWLRGDKASGKEEVRFYSHQTGDTKTLDSIAFGNNYTAMEVALGEKDVFWTTLNLIGGKQQYGTMQRMDIKTGEVTDFSKGYNLVNPIIVGDHLIIRNKPEGNNYLPDTVNGGNISGELWVYDLKNNKWKFKVTTALPMLDKYAVMLMPEVIDETHVALKVEGMRYTCDMPIIDLETGRVQTAIDNRGNVLLYNLTGNEENVVVMINEKGSDSTNLMQFTGKGGTWNGGYKFVKIED